MKKTLILLLFFLLSFGATQAQSSRPSFYTGGFAYGGMAWGLGIEASFGKYFPYKLGDKIPQVYLGGGIGVFAHFPGPPFQYYMEGEQIQEWALGVPVFLETRVVPSRRKFALYYGLRLSAENTFVRRSRFVEEEWEAVGNPFYQLVPVLTPLGGFRWHIWKHFTLSLKFGIELRPKTYGNPLNFSPLMCWVFEFR